MQLRLHPMICRVALLAVVTLASNVCLGQDKLANQAPIDHKMRAIDSISLQRLIDIEEEEMPAFSLYEDEWSNDYAHYVGKRELPSEFRIDLRHFAMPTSSRNVTSSYGYRRKFGRIHKGLDVKVYVGDTIVAAFAGKVRVVKDAGRRKGYGKYIVIRHPNGLETIYGHLSKQLVVENQVVKAGEPIGLGGNTGRSYGSHLHFETRLLGDDINPALIFDFENQDVRGDYYVYRGHNQGYCYNDVDGNTRSDVASRGENEVWKQSPEEAEISAKAAAKAAESRKFQQERTAQRTTSGRIHKVRKGDTLGLIAKQNGTTVDRLCKLNGLKVTSILHLGQIIKVN